MARSARALAILACCAAFAIAGSARADVANEGTFWTGYMSTWWLNPSWGLWFDTHYNVDSFFIVRGGASYAFESGPIATGGYAWLLLNPEFERHEHRAWGQVFMPHRFNDKWSLSGRFRLDARWLESLDNTGSITSGWDFILRTRFQTVLTRRLPPVKLGKPFVSFAHEILLNAASSPSVDVFDQNRLSLLYGIEMKYVTIRVGYMNRYLNRARGGEGVLEHSAIVWFTQRVDLSNRSRSSKQPDPEDYPEIGSP